MIKGYAQRRLDMDSWEIALVDSLNKRHYTIEFKSHDSEPESLKQTSIIGREIQEMGILKALADALIQMEVFPRDATQAQLEATKYHLEDMRALVKVYSNPTFLVPKMDEKNDHL